MKKYLVILLTLIASRVSAQISISMRIEYMQNKDTILNDSVVPYLRIEFKNHTDTAQYFVLDNYEKYPQFLPGSTLHYATPEEHFVHKNKFEYTKWNDKHYIYIYNKYMDILHTDLRTIGDDEFPQELISTEFSKCYNILRNRQSRYVNDVSKIILLNPNQSFTVSYDLTMCALVCGEYEFIFEMMPTSAKLYPQNIATYKRCEQFDGQKELIFKP